MTDRHDGKSVPSSEDDESFDSESALLDVEESRALLRKRKSQMSKKWLLHGSLLLINVALMGAMAALIHKEAKPSQLLPGELGLLKDIAKYEPWEVHAPGYTSDDTRSIFAELPSPASDAAWMNITSRGAFIGLTQDQNAHLAFPAGESHHKPGQYPIGLAVFHQLHCLYFLRKVIYSKEGSVVPDRFSGSAIDLQDEHISHCLDTLRRTLMCHGDLTPIPMRWDAELQGYRFTWPLIKTCRNFEEIAEWASQPHFNTAIPVQ